MFDTIFTTTSDGSISITQSVIAIGAAFIIGFVIAAVYMFICKKEGCQKNFISGLAMLPAVVAVSYSSCRQQCGKSFLNGRRICTCKVQKRTWKCQRYINSILHNGSRTCLRIGYVTFAAVFVAVMLIVLIGATAIGFGDRNTGKKQLKITIPENLNYSSVFDDLFDKYTSEYKMSRVKTTNMGTMYELTYEVRLKDESQEKDFIDQLRIRNGNLNNNNGTYAG